MRDGDVDDILRRAAQESAEADPALLARIANTIDGSLKPVRPLPSFAVLGAAAAGTCAAIASAGAYLLGMHGVRAMSAAEAAVIFPVVGVLIGFAAAMAVRAVIPGAGRLAAAWVLPAAGSAALSAAFVLVFDDYRTERFVRQGMSCLTAGIANAIPAALAGWWLLRRGFAVDAVSAGAAQGALAGLAGVAMLELHCPNFEVPHVVVWHTAVLLVSAGAGALFARLRARRS